MGRPKEDEFWNHVESGHNGLKCKYCGDVFPPSTSISRIKYHLSGESGGGIRRCKRVPDNVKSNAYEAIQESNKRRKTMPSSSSNPSSRQQNDQVETEQTPFEVQAPRHEMVPETANSSANNDGETGQDQAGNESFSVGSACPSFEMTPWKRGTIDVDGILTANNAVETEQDQVGIALIPNDEDPTLESTSTSHGVNENVTINNDREIGQDQGHRLDLTSTSHGVNGNFTANNAAETRQDGGGETLVGQNFKINKEKVWECLMNDKISRIGIYGMGGCGKTALMKHIRNQLKENSFTVYWITLWQDFEIYRLQTLIAKSIKLDLSSESEIERADELREALKEKQKCVLILDNLWEHFSLNDVGIPIDANGCKLALTTRSLDVCEKMSCKEKIQVVPLKEDEAWRLFEAKLEASLPLGVIDIAKSIAKECDGLPLGIVTMAASMRGVDDVHEWRNALTELKESQVSDDDMNKKVFAVLKFSYNRLTDSTLQQCFLYCALYPEHEQLSREELIEKIIDEGIIQGENWEKANNKGHTMLNRLERACLLERLEGLNLLGNVALSLKMHDLIRDMAIQIITANRGAILKAGAGLEEIPGCDKWTEDLSKVSLAKNNIKEIPPGFSPRCPKLSTLLLRYNSLEKIPDSFFEQLKGLKFLDLSYNASIEKLPESISDLENLNVLLLSSCLCLQHVPSLSKLKALKKLSLDCCLLVQRLPQGIEVMSNLRHLDLYGTIIKEFPAGILPQLSNLQFLRIPCYLKGEELASLRKLETLMCGLDSVGELNTFTSTPPSHLNCYTLVVGKFNSWSDVNETNAMHERKLIIVHCFEREHFLSLSSCSPSLFQSLQYIAFNRLKGENARPPRRLSLPGSTFSQIKEFKMHKCRRMKELFPPGVVSNFHNLERLLVSFCAKMEEIIATEEEQFVFPKLKLFSLQNLPNLESICRGNMICDSLEYMQILSCEKLNRVAVSLVTNNGSHLSPLPSLKSIRVSPKEWWETVELVYPNAKNILSPLCEFVSTSTNNATVDPEVVEIVRKAFREYMRTTNHLTPEEVEFVLSSL